MDQIRINTKVTRGELATLVGLSPDGVKYHLQKMIKDGIIIRNGSARSGHWEIVISE